MGYIDWLGIIECTIILTMHYGIHSGYSDPRWTYLGYREILDKEVVHCYFLYCFYCLHKHWLSKFCIVRCSFYCFLFRDKLNLQTNLCQNTSKKMRMMFYTLKVTELKHVLGKKMEVWDLSSWESKFNRRESAATPRFSLVLLSLG